MAHPPSSIVSCPSVLPVLYTCLCSKHLNAGQTRARITFFVDFLLLSSRLWQDFHDPSYLRSQLTLLDWPSEDSSIVKVRYVSPHIQTILHVSIPRMIFKAMEKNSSCPKAPEHPTRTPVLFFSFLKPRMDGAVGCRGIILHTERKFAYIEHLPFSLGLDLSCITHDLSDFQ
jgi:hypothetical protein